MKFTKLSLIAALAVRAITTSAMAEVEVSANVAATNNYVWRGMTQANDAAAVQGGLDLGMGGFYLGTWTSNVAGDTEVDGYAGYAGDVSGLSYDLGFIRYGYLDAPGSNFNEAYLGLGYDFGAASLGATYSKGLDDAPDDIGVDLSIPVMQDYSLDLAAGEYDTYGKRYSLGVSKSFDKVDFSLTYSKFSADTGTGNTGQVDQNNVIVSAGTSF
jgi:uncharacterized protein (TIGR02001 family)